MKWYVAHVVEAIVTASDHPGGVEAYENMYLVAAESDQAARERAEHLGRQNEQFVDETLTLNGLPARWRFLGVRKLITISNPVDVHSQDEEPPRDGTELSYSLLKFGQIADAEAFARGDQIALTALE
jgi:hypothetical protein